MKMTFKSVAEDGGVRRCADSEAPKTITDSRIISFACDFSTLSLAEELLGNRSYQLEATLSGSKVTGSYRSHDRFGGRFNRSLQAEAAFMERLQNIVQQYHFAEYNGCYTHVCGLPDNYGASIRVTFASGEEIRASDNQDCFLSVEAMTELEGLFYDHSHDETS